MSSEAINRPPNGASYDQNAASDQDGLPRRNSLERYRPGAYFNEEREKLRRRAHFGERRLEENNGGGGHHNQRSNGRSRGGRGRGGGNRGHGGKNFNSYRNKTRDEDFDDSSNGENAEPEFIPAADPLQTSPPPIGNWADQLESPETVNLFSAFLNYVKKRKSLECSSQTMPKVFKRKENGSKFCRVVSGNSQKICFRQVEHGFLFGQNIVQKLKKRHFQLAMKIHFSIAQPFQNPRGFRYLISVTMSKRTYFYLVFCIFSVPNQGRG